MTPEAKGDLVGFQFSCQQSCLMVSNRAQAAQDRLSFYEAASLRHLISKLFVLFLNRKNRLLRHSFQLLLRFTDD